MPGILSNIPGYLHDGFQLFVVCAGILPGLIAEKVMGSWLVQNKTWGFIIDIAIGLIFGLISILVMRNIVIDNLNWGSDAMINTIVLCVAIVGASIILALTKPFRRYSSSMYTL